MDLNEHQFYSGNRHPWEVSRVDALKRIIFSKCHPQNNIKILDIGCGDGYTVANIFQGMGTFEIDAVDCSLSPEQIDFFSKRYQLIRFHSSIEELGKKKFDIINIFDVIEHNTDPIDFLRIISSYAKPGACILITVPAFNFLYSKHDAFLGHYSRFSRRELHQLIIKTDLQIADSGYIFFSLLLVRHLTVFFEKIFNNTQSTPQQGVSNWQYANITTKTISSLLIYENKLTIWLNSIGLPLPGLSTWAICKKPQ